MRPLLAVTSEGESSAAGGLSLLLLENCIQTSRSLTESAPRSQSGRNPGGHDRKRESITTATYEFATSASDYQ